MHFIFQFKSLTVWLPLTGMLGFHEHISLSPLLPSGATTANHLPPSNPVLSLLFLCIELSWFLLSPHPSCLLPAGSNLSLLLPSYSPSLLHTWSKPSLSGWLCFNIYALSPWHLPHSHSQQTIQSQSPLSIYFPQHHWLKNQTTSVASTKTTVFDPFSIVLVDTSNVF